MIGSERVKCPKCENKFLMECTVGNLGSYAFEGECSCKERYFVSVTSLALYFNPEEQNKMTIEEMIEKYICDNTKKRA